MGLIYSKILTFIPVVSLSSYYNQKEDETFEDIELDTPFIYYHVDDFNDDYKPFIKN